MDGIIERNLETSVSTAYSSAASTAAAAASPVHPQSHPSVFDMGIENGLNQISAKAPSPSTWTDSSDQTLIIIFQMTVLIMLGICGTLTNVLVFWIFNRRPALRSLSNRFVLSLVSGNVLLSSIIGPLILLDVVLTHYIVLPCLSQFISAASNSVVFGCTLSILLIATDRYFAVTSPLHYSMTITRGRSQIMIVVAWTCGILISLPYIFQCLIPKSDLEFQHNFHSSFLIIQLTLGYSLPFVGLCWLYLRMYHAAHRNSERTRKHSISGELLTVMDGTTNLIPQGIDFLTHYMNPFSRAPMAGSVQPVQPAPPSATGIIVVPPKKPRRRSSNGSSSSLLFREEGRAIKTAFFVLGSFVLCWSPHFSFKLTTELNLYANEYKPLFIEYGDWNLFFSVSGILLSSILNPFIYVFRNKMARKEAAKLLCGYVRDEDGSGCALDKKGVKENGGQHHNNHGLQQQSTQSSEFQYNNSYDHETTAAGYENEDTLGGGGGGDNNGSCGGDYGSIIPYNHHGDDSQELARYQSSSLLPQNHPVACLQKSPRRSSMKSLTPQSSLNSTSTHVNLLANGGCSTNSSSLASPITTASGGKPPFLRSVTLPEQTQNRVKFNPNLIRQKSYIQRTVSGPPTTEILMVPGGQGGGGHGHSHGHGQPYILTNSGFANKKARFIRQDSICSILSNDSVLMICEEDGHGDDNEFDEPQNCVVMIPGRQLQKHHSTGDRDHEKKYTGGGILRNSCQQLAQPQPQQQTRSSHNSSSSSSSSSTTGHSVAHNAHSTAAIAALHHYTTNGRQVAYGGGTYLRQDSNFSDISHKTNDSGVVADMNRSKHNSSSGGSPDSFTGEVATTPSPQQQQAQQQPQPQQSLSESESHCQNTNHHYIGTVSGIGSIGYQQFNSSLDNSSSSSSPSGKCSKKACLRATNSSGSGVCMHELPFLQTTI